MSAVLERKLKAIEGKRVGPLLESGQHLSQLEFHARYELMPNVKKAELVKGIVIMGSPISKWHADSTMNAAMCAKFYAVAIPGVEASSAASMIVDFRNEYQPDVYMRLTEECQGQTHVGEDDYIYGAPELVIEIALSSAAYDLHEKLEVYQQHRVREYIVWQGEKNEMSFFRFEDSHFVEARADADGVFRSKTFPGFWFDVAALLRGDENAALNSVQKSLATPEAADFRAELERRKASK